MTESDASKPWLLIDVDGVLNVWPGSQRPGGNWEEHVVVNHRNDVPYRLHLNPVHAEWLNGLTNIYDLAWCTTWTGIASRVIGPPIGLPAGLPHVPLPDPRYADVKMSWKTPYVRFWLAGGPAAWIDGDITSDDDDARMQPDDYGSHSTAALAIGIDPKSGSRGRTSRRSANGRRDCREREATSAGRCRRSAQCAAESGSPRRRVGGA